MIGGTSPHLLLLLQACCFLLVLPPFLNLRGQLGRMPFPPLLLSIGRKEISVLRPHGTLAPRMHTAPTPLPSYPITSHLLGSQRVLRRLLLLQQCRRRGGALLLLLLLGRGNRFVSLALSSLRSCIRAGWYVNLDDLAPCDAIQIKSTIWAEVGWVLWGGRRGVGAVGEVRGGRMRGTSAASLSPPSSMRSCSRAARASHVSCFETRSCSKSESR